MTKFVAASFLMMLALAIVEAQTSGDPSYKLGDVSVVIPAPDGFENIIDAIPNDHGRFSANDGAGLLAIDIPSATIPELKTTPLMSLDLYTRVVIAPQLRQRKITAEKFAQVVAEYKKNIDSFYDVTGNVMTSARNDVRLWMSQVRGRITNVDISKPRTIALFNESPDVLSTLMLIVLDVDGHKVPMLVSMSMMHIRDRLVNVAVYKRQPAENDVDMITEFTKTWTAAITAANQAH